MSKKNPQEQTFNIVMNNNQLAHIVAALESYIPNQPTDVMGEVVDTEFDTTDTMYVSIEDTLELLKDVSVMEGTDVLYGICL